MLIEVENKRYLERIELNVVNEFGCLNIALKINK
jgi:hypothetical protein